MKIPFGLAGRLIFSFIALILLSQWFDYRFGRDLHSTAVQSREVDKIASVAREIEPRIKREAEWVSSVARLIQGELSREMQRTWSERSASIARTLDLFYRQSKVNVLEVTNDRGIVLYRAQEPDRYGDLDTNWGVEEALSGIGGLVSARDAGGSLVKYIEPILAGNKVIGTVSAGIRIDEKFINALSTEMGVELSLVARSGEVLASSKHGKTIPEATAIKDAFQQKIPVYRVNEGTRTTHVYLPVLIVDDAWVIMGELDSSSAYALLHDIDEDSALITLLLMIGSTLITLIVLRHALKPLREVRRRAEKDFQELKGEMASKAPRDDLFFLAQILNTCRDTLMDRNRELSEQRADLRISATAFESQEATMITDANLVVLRVNESFTRITGYTGDEVIGQKPRISSFNRHESDFFREKWETIRCSGSWQGEVWDQRKNGEAYPKWLTISAVKNDEGTVTHYIFAHIDITERKKAEERIEELAFFDPLTQLPNRTLLMDRLKRVMTSSSRNGTFGAVLFIDLDDFKTLNDTMGHDKGDLLLQQVAQRLVTCVREEDTVARLGGDEFVIVLGNLNKAPQEAAKQTEIVGEKILAALGDIYQFNDVDHRSSASIGATLFCGQQTSVTDLFRQADLAMYKAKESGRNTLCFFDPDMQAIVME
jgi:diguanylate cyclase (GGDEF)-like protein/PAS domain S-box-containing protein